MPITFGNDGMRIKDKGVRALYVALASCLVAGLRVTCKWQARICASALSHPSRNTFVKPATGYVCRWMAHLYLCLGKDNKFELRPLLRNGISDNGLQEAIQHAITLKPERHEFSEKPSQVVRFMSVTGG